MPYLKTINNMCFVFLIPIFFIETKNRAVKKIKCLVELKIKFHRLLNALGRYIRKYKISNH
jgi:hypothetical protein